MGEFRRWMRDTVYEEPLTGGVHELMGAGATLDDARVFVDAWPDDFSMHDVYLHLQERAAPVLVVDKSPGNAEHANFVRTACHGWERASFIHLFRHPSPAIASTLELRKSIALTQGFAGLITDADLFDACEQTWLEGNANILEVLPSEAAGDCAISVNYETLVTSPEPTLQAVCKCLDLPFEVHYCQSIRRSRTRCACSHALRFTCVWCRRR